MKSRWQLIAGVTAIVVVFGIVVGVGYSYFSKPAPKPKEKKEKIVKKKPKPAPKIVLCPFDGEEAKLQVSRPLAIMVENLSTIRPQAGIGNACVVVEGLAEGGITRFMLVFGSHGSDNVGPVRSARTHFVALARGWNAIFAHVGGSIYAMKDIRDWNVADWDQVGHPAAYERVKWTKAPHNVFTSTVKLRSAAVKYQDGGSMESGLKFKKKPEPEARPEGLKKVSIDFSRPAYRVVYQYDRQTNTYKRFNGGEPFVDANTKLQVAPANIVIVRAPTSSIPGGSGVLDVNMMGTGSLTVFRDGEIVEGTWEKLSSSSPLTLKDPAGEEISLSPGQTWIEIVTPTTQVTIEQ